MPDPLEGLSFRQCCHPQVPGYCTVPAQVPLPCTLGPKAAQLHSKQRRLHGSPVYQLADQAVHSLLQGSQAHMQRCGESTMCLKLIIGWHG